MTEIAPIFSYFFTVKLLIDFYQKWVGLHFGRHFQKNESGHPAEDRGWLN
jgi:hypothetical protein